MQQGLVSTIIPVYNRPEMLLEAVDSVLAQTYQSIEIIIVNDGSTDTTQQVINHLVENHSVVSSITISNSGPAMARQAGLDRANGEFIQFLDSDDLLYPEKFAKQVAGLNQACEVGVSYCVQEYRHINGNLLDATWMRTGECFKTMFPAMLGGRIWGTPAPLYRANVLNQVGPWMDLKNQEDWEYDCRLASLGIKLNYQNEALVMIRHHEDLHYGQIDRQQTIKLADKAKAYRLIYKHARTANIARSNPESKRFARMAFMLARQCAAQNLINEAKHLINICNDASSSLLEKFEYKLYSLFSNSFGWQRVATLSQRIRD